MFSQSSLWITISWMNSVLYAFLVFAGDEGVDVAFCEIMVCSVLILLTSDLFNFSLYIKRQSLLAFGLLFPALPFG